jgi:hypothetical protein
MTDNYCHVEGSLPGCFCFTSEGHSFNCKEINNLNLIISHPQKLRKKYVGVLYATSRKTVVLFPDEAIVFFNWHNPSSLNIALGSTQRLTEMSTRNILGGKGRTARKGDNLTAICEKIFQKMWEPRCLTILWASTAVTRIALPVFNHPEKCVALLMILKRIWLQRFRKWPRRRDV